MTNLTIPYASRAPFIRDDETPRLMQLAGQQRAEGMRRGGDIWGGAINSLGQLASGTIQNIAEEKKNAPLRALQTAKIEGEVKRMNDENRLSDVMQNKASFEAAGQAPMDVDQVMGYLQQNGLGNMAPGVLKDLESVKKIKDEHLEQNAYNVARFLDVGKKYANDENALGILAATMKQAGIQGVDEVYQRVVKLPAEQRGVAFDALIAQSKRYSDEKAQRGKPLVVAGRLVTPEGVVKYEPPPDAPKPPGTRLVTITNADGSKEERIVPDVPGTVFKSATQPKGEGTSATRSDRIYQQERTVIDKMSAPIEDRAARAERLLEAVNARTPAADALIAPELLTVMAGGTGSGLRMSEAELEKIRRGRSRWEDLKAVVNKWNPDSGKALEITDSQREQIRDLITAVNEKAAVRVRLIDEARNALIDAQTPEDSRRITARLKSQLSSLGGSDELLKGGETWAPTPVKGFSIREKK